MSSRSSRELENPLLSEEDNQRENEDLTIWGDEPLPGWIKDNAIKQILEHDRKEQHFEPVDLNRTAGPAVLWGFSTLVGLTYFLGALPVVGTYIARCPAEERSNEFANYPEVLLWIIFFLPLMCMILVAQWKIMTFVFVPMAMQIRKYRVDEAKPWPFNAWFCIFSVMAVFNLLDQMTNALFVSKTWATRHCYGYQFIEHTWQETLRESLVCRIFLLDKLGLDFAEFSLATYVIQLIVQPIVGLVYSMPVWYQDVRQETADHCRGLPVNYNVVVRRGGHTAEYKTLSDDAGNEEDLTTHSSAAVILAEVNRMEAVVSQDMAYRMALCKQLQTKLKEKLHEVGSGEGAFEAKKETFDKCLEIAIAAAGRGIARFCLRGLLQNAVQVNLQVSMAAISKTVLKGGIDLFNAFSISTTVISMFFDVPDIQETFNFATNVMTKVEQQFQGHDGERLKEALERKVDSLRWRIWRLQLYAVLYCLLAALALMKLFFAVFVCKYGTDRKSVV